MHGHVFLLEQGTNVCRDHTLGISPSLFIVEKDVQVQDLALMPIQCKRTLGPNSSGPKVFDRFEPLRSFVTPSLDTTMSSMNRVFLFKRAMFNEHP